MKKRETTPLESWKALAEPIRFTPADFEILDLTLYLIPDLRICALALKEARSMKVRYPIGSVDELLSHVKKGKLVAGNHVIDSDEIRAYMPGEFFPIEHEGDLLSKIYAGLGRQRSEVAFLSAVDPKMVEKFVAARKSTQVRTRKAPPVKARKSREVR
jgi:hypothetical protein